MNNPVRKPTALGLLEVKPLWSYLTVCIRLAEGLGIREGAGDISQEKRSDGHNAIFRVMSIWLENREEGG